MKPILLGLQSSTVNPSFTLVVEIFLVAYLSLLLLNNIRNVSGAILTEYYGELEIRDGKNLVTTSKWQVLSIVFFLEVLVLLAESGINGESEEQCRTGVSFRADKLYRKSNIYGMKVAYRRRN